MPTIKNPGSEILRGRNFVLYGGCSCEVPTLDGLDDLIRSGKLVVVARADRQDAAPGRGRVRPAGMPESFIADRHRDATGPLQATRRAPAAQAPAPRPAAPAAASGDAHAAFVERGRNAWKTPLSPSKH